MHKNIFNLATYLSLFFFFILCTPIFGQLEQSHRNYALELIEQEAKTLKAMEVASPFSQPLNRRPSSARSKRIDDAIKGDKDFFYLSSTFLNEIIKGQNELLKLSIPRENGESIKLYLKKVNLLGPAINASLADKSSGVFYWGVVEGDKSSFANISIFNEELLGTITTKEGVLTLGKIDNTDEYILYNEEDLEEKTAFTCNARVDVEELNKQRRTALKRASEGFVNPDNCVLVHLWANNSLYQEFDKDVNALSTYLHAYFSPIALLYANEHINVLLNHVTIAKEEQVTVFGSAERTGNFIMFLDYHQGGGGGAAGGPLCGGGGHSHIGSDYKDTGIPTLTEGIGVLAHEIGHVLGAPHTHQCFWNGNNTQIDDCGNYSIIVTSEGCFDPYNPISPPNGVGTIMSYCAMNFSNGFGQQPGDLIRRSVYTSTCLSPCDQPCIDGNKNGTCDKDECYPNPIICRANIADQGWTGRAGDEGGAGDIKLLPNQSVQFDPTIGPGTFSWSGSNGFSSTDKLITVSTEGTYTFTYIDGDCTYRKDMTVTIDRSPLSPIICRSKINNQAWTNDGYVGILQNEQVTFRPEDKQGGLWSWSGPNGFSSNQQEITVQEKGKYIVTYSKDGFSVSKEVRVYLCEGDLRPSLVVPGVLTWQVTDKVTIDAGQTVEFSVGVDNINDDNVLDLPRENAWSGPNGFSSTEGHIRGLTEPGTYTYTATQAICTWTQEMTISFSACKDNITSFANVQNRGWEEATVITRNQGEVVALAPTPTSGNWSWTGPNNFSANSREINVTVVGKYIATYTEGDCSLTKEIIITECGTNPIQPRSTVNNRNWSRSTGIYITNGEVFISPDIGEIDFVGKVNKTDVEWFWTGPNGFVSSQHSVRIPYTQVGTYTLRVTYGSCSWTKDFYVVDCNINSACDDGNDATLVDFIDTNCECVGMTMNDCNNTPINRCQYTTDRVNYITTCDITLCEGESLIYTFSGCDANLLLNLKGPNGFNENSLDDCGSILVSSFLKPNMSGEYTATLIDKTTGCYTISPVTITVVVDTNDDDVCDEDEINNCKKGKICDDGNDATPFDFIDTNCTCVGITMNDCGNNGPNNECQYTTNGVNYISTCDITLCEGENLVYTFFGCDANLLLNLKGPNEFNENSSDDCGSILVSSSLKPNMSGEYTATLIDKTTGCYTISTVTITVIADTNGDGVCDEDEIKGCTLGSACDDGNNCTINDVMDDDCNCVGTLLGVDINGNCSVSCTDQLICFAKISTQGWQQTCDVILSKDESVTFGPSNASLESGAWSWIGPGGFTSSSREITVSASGSYQFTFTTNTCTYTKSVNVTGDNCTLNTSCDDNNGATINDTFDENCNCIGSQTKVQAKVWMEGFYDAPTAKMRTTFQSKGLIPVAQPFNQAPWNYTGTERATTIPNSVVDWILIIARDKAGNILHQSAGFLDENGFLLDVAGGVGIPLEDAVGNYISIHTRSHLAVISSTTYTGGVYDFTSASIQAKGVQQLKEIAGKYMLYAGDFDSSGVINSNDFNNWKIQGAALNQYLPIDGDGNGIINNTDYNLWIINNAKVGEPVIRY